MKAKLKKKLRILRHSQIQGNFLILAKIRAQSQVISFQLNTRPAC